MIREPTEQEKEMITRGIERVEKEMKKYNVDLEQTKEYQNNIVIPKRAFEDKWRQTNRDKEDNEINNTIKGYESEIKMCEEKLKDLNKQLTEIEVRDKPEIPAGVG